jgi:hypothetical protein
MRRAAKKSIGARFVANQRTESLASGEGEAEANKPAPIGKSLSGVSRMGEVITVRCLRQVGDSGTDGGGAYRPARDGAKVPGPVGDSVV